MQVLFNLVLSVVCISLWLRSRRPPQDDPRLSRGLQLLQTKITVLEDLSDRTENQVKQLSSMLDQKTRILQNKVIEAEEQILKIDHSMNKSMEVAEIFQDKIPHQEILERQRTVEYVKAARMAHSGMGVDEISKAVHLPREQVELIAKFNRDQLMFDETQLPGWAMKANESGDDPSFALGEIDFVGGLEKPQMDFAPSDKIESDFRSAVENMKQFEANPPARSLMETKVGEKVGETLQPAVLSLKAKAQSLKEKLVSSAEDLLRQQVHTSANPVTVSKVISSSNKTTAAPSPIGPATVRKVIFPRIEK